MRAAWRFPGGRRPGQGCGRTPGAGAERAPAQGSLRALWGLSPALPTALHTGAPARCSSARPPSHLLTFLCRWPMPCLPILDLLKGHPRSLPDPTLLPSPLLLSIPFAQANPKRSRLTGLPLGPLSSLQKSQPYHKANLCSRPSTLAINQMWSIHKVEYYSALKRNKAWPQATMWTKLKNTMLRDRSQM